MSKTEERKENLFGQLKKKMGAGNDGGYRLDFHIDPKNYFSSSNNRRKEKQVEGKFCSFRVVEEEPKRRLCPEAQSLSLMAFQRKARLFRWIIGG